MPISSACAKLHLKEPAEIVILNAPTSFDAEIAKLQGVFLRGTLPGRGPMAVRWRSRSRS
jgi:hypothetical protein